MTEGVPVAFNVCFAVPLDVGRIIEGAPLPFNVRFAVPEDVGNIIDGAPVAVSPVAAGARIIKPLVELESDEIV